MTGRTEHRSGNHATLCGAHRASLNWERLAMWFGLTSVGAR
jgi:hypothetical protein